MAVLLAALGLPTGTSAQVGSPAGGVPPALLEARRARLAEIARGAPVVIGASRLRDLEHEYPQDSDFRQSNDFFYLTGLETPGAWLVLNLPDPGAATLYLEPRNPAQELWTGRKLGPGPEASRRSGIADVRSTASFASDLRAWLARTRPRAVAIEPGHPDRRSELEEALGDAPAMIPADRWVAGLRLIKDEDEIARLREAVRITSEAHQRAWRLAAPGVAEYELEALIEHTFRSLGAERLGFPSIVASGENTVTLHYDKNRRTLEAGDLVVVDIGAEYGYYTADLTRTFPASGRFTERQRALYELVLGAQNAAIEAVRPGVTVARLNQVSRQYMDAHSGELCGGASCATFFPHGLSHWLGMDVHDVGDYGVPLAPGMVLTIEPGVYLEEEGLGIRIEDDVLVTDTGYEILSADLPRSSEDIEAIMAEAPLPLRAGASGPHTR